MSPTTTSGFDDPLTWINFGVLGLMVMALLTGWIWAKPAVERIIEENKRLVLERDQALAQVNKMAEAYQEKFLPIVGEFVATIKTATPALQDIQKFADETKAILRGEDRGPERRSGR